MHRDYTSRGMPRRTFLASTAAAATGAVASAGELVVQRDAIPSEEHAPKREGRLGLPTVDLVAEESDQKNQHVVNVFIRNFGREIANMPFFVGALGVPASKSVKVYLERDGEISEIPKPYGLSPFFLFANPGDGDLSEYYANPQGGTYSLEPGEKKLLFRYAINDPGESRVRLWFTLCIPDMGRDKDVGEIAVLLRSNILILVRGRKGEEKGTSLIIEKAK